MRLLLDECVPARLRRALTSHEVSTVVIEGWSGIKNGSLLALAAQRFDAFITVDKNLPYQQNTAALPVAVLVLDAVSNELAYLLPLIPHSSCQPWNCNWRSSPKAAASSSPPTPGLTL